jgi:hypothetical protein
VSATSPVYCIDTSSLIGAFVRHYPQSSFPGFWREFEQLIDAGRVFSPRAVYDELKDRNDDLTAWAKNHDTIFLPPSVDTMVFVGNIGVHFPQTLTTTIAANKADPWLVAFGAVKSWTVVTEERGSSREIPTIPQMCRRYGVQCVALVDVIKAEKWVFH